MKIYDMLSYHQNEVPDVAKKRISTILSFLKEKNLLVDGIVNLALSQIDETILNEKGKAFLDMSMDTIRNINVDDLRITLDKLYTEFQKAYGMNVMENAIVVEASYFKNIEVAIKAINDFLGSGFKNQNFPMLNDDFELDSNIQSFINTFKKVSPNWISNPENAENAIEFIMTTHEENTSEQSTYSKLVAEDNTQAIDTIESFIAYKKLLFIADNFEDFTNVIQGIYSLKIFTNPDEFKNSIQKMQTITIDEIADIFDEDEIDPSIITPTRIVNAVFDNNNQITLPSSLIKEEEIKRLNDYRPLEMQIVINDQPVDEYYVQEAADVNYFKDIKPVDIKYNASSDRFEVSKQLKSQIRNLISGIENCNTTEDLNNFFAEYGDPSDMIKTNFPFLLSKVFWNKKKYSKEIEEKKLLQDYIGSYSSIANKNKGARRFISYDLYTLFKTDKEGTIQFLKDFFYLDLYNNKDVVISNNVALAIFNIYDSHIYFDILYNVSGKSDVTNSEFIKESRKRINKNSHEAKPYDNGENETKPKKETSKEIHEYAISRFNAMGDVSLADMQFCEGYRDILMDEILCFEDAAYNANLSQQAITKYIGESFDVIQEVEKGAIPDYMQNRIAVSDEENGGHQDMPVEPVELPPDIPTNPIDDLANSINAKLDVDGDIEQKLGSGYENNPNRDKNASHVVYNITNNYTNSFNKHSDSHNTTSYDLSSNKRDSHNTVYDLSTKTNAKDSYNKNVPIRRAKNNTKGNVSSSGIYSEKNGGHDELVKLESGLTVQEMFTFLEAAEPQTNEGTSATPNKAKPPKDDALTKAMDKDRETLGKQEEAKKKVQKAVNTGRAIVKPFSRTKKWLIKTVDSLIKRDEETVKAQIIESPSYRTALYKATRLALKLGLATIAFTISGYLGAAYLVLQGAKLADRQRLRKEVEEEFMTEIQIVDEKIKQADREDTPESRKRKYQLMRMKSKMIRIVGSASKSHFARPNNVS